MVEVGRALIARRCRALPLVALALILPACGASSKLADLAAAKGVFMRNIEAIQQRDKEAYLACYRSDESLVRAGLGGLKMGFDELATGTPTTASDAWPSTLEASDIELRWLQSGVVYGAYRYRVVIDGVETTGLSERVFIRDGGDWRIAVTTAFPGAAEE